MSLFSIDAVVVLDCSDRRRLEETSIRTMTGRDVDWKVPENVVVVVVTVIGVI